MERLNVHGVRMRLTVPAVGSMNSNATIRNVFETNGVVTKQTIAVIGAMRSVAMN